MKRIAKEEMYKIEGLCEQIEETLIWSCLDGSMGEACCDEGESAVKIVIADFGFLLGDADSKEAKALTTYLPTRYYKPNIILVPQNEAWCRHIKEVYGEKAMRIIRYAFKKHQEHFDCEKLKGFIKALPTDYTIVPIDAHYYEASKQEQWSRGFCDHFVDWDDYAQRGLGFMVCYKGEPVCGASSYTVYKGGIEIEIYTKEAFRQKGLATACGAKLILTCLERGLYPSWDAANLKSVGLAEKLGYVYSHEYVAYAVTL
ncbi:GNAT family N-acetyltransferase [Cellulosilyticum ruminicola]|uniref:GNAT family N-acetyltransferase n=1 Tax=Cellulosilyticum ruminicola TaxID=425254 RepID=UPI0006D19AD7|nr:GNAT family N-acetyltransferase [Cellulosilyticum ruminicola]